MNDVPRAALRRIDEATAFGSGDRPDEVGDDRGGHYWLITEDRVRMAVKIALITGRPLLVEGPSGSGKSALARAIGESLRWTYYETVVTSQTRLEQLIGGVDLVQRLHHAEVAGRRDDEPLPGLHAFVQPGVLWWLFDPESAASAGQGGHVDPGQPARTPPESPDEAGAVLLIDEIDKAEPDLPNNLLVPLGSLELRIEGRREEIRLARPQRPLVIITSNRERDMPVAFLRRCVSVGLGQPKPEQLVAIAEHHVAPADEGLTKLVLTKVAGDRNEGVSAAEFIDAVRAADGLGLDDTADQATWDAVREIVLGPPGAAGGGRAE